MEKSIKGDVVVVPFPFSDITQYKRRPALVIADLDGDDLILCQITSQQVKDKYAVSINEDDFKTGSLRQRSNIRPNRIFTADRHIILYCIGHLKSNKSKEITNKIIEILMK